MQGGDAAAGDISVEKGGHLENIGGKLKKILSKPSWFELECSPSMKQDAIANDDVRRCAYTRMEEGCHLQKAAGRLIGPLEAEAFTAVRSRRCAYKSMGKGCQMQPATCKLGRLVSRRAHLQPLIFGAAPA
jgi:hypothetical protein